MPRKRSRGVIRPGYGPLGPTFLAQPSRAAWATAVRPCCCSTLGACTSGAVGSLLRVSQSEPGDGPAEGTQSMQQRAKSSQH